MVDRGTPARLRFDVLVTLCLAIAAAPAAGAAVPAARGEAEPLPVGWLMRQAELDVARMTGSDLEDTRRWQSEVGSAGRPSAKKHKKYDAPLVPMLMSLVLPGSGEAFLGHKRGFFMMALDIASWYGVAHNADQGRRKRDEYYDFADAHWSLDRLEAAYQENFWDRPDAVEWSQWGRQGFEYFGVNQYWNLPLWVSEADDRREYYENLGKWDQFVFGWDDYQDPRAFLGLPEDETSILDLKDPRTSANREIYREMRQVSNAAFARRDRFLYLSIGLRVFSVLQVAYLEGLLFGGNDSGPRNEPRQLSVAGHRIDLIVEPVGLSRGVIGAAVSF